MTGNQKSCEIYFKKLFFQNVLAFLIFFIVTIISVISSTQIACDVMRVQYVQKQPPEVFFKKGVVKHFANLTGKTQHIFADEMICNKLLIGKIRAVFRISIKLYLNVRKTGWKKIRFQLALNKTYSLTPPPTVKE